MIAHRVIAGRDVYVTSEEIKIQKEPNGPYVGGQFYAAFKLDFPPGMIAGECVREKGKLKLFGTVEEAIEAAFQLAKDGLKGGQNP